MWSSDQCRPTYNQIKRKINIISFSDSIAETVSVLYIHRSSSLSTDPETVIMLVHNSAETAIMYIMDSTCYLSGHLTLSHNSAKIGVIYLQMVSKMHLSGNTTLSDNMGSLVAIMSNVTF